MGGVSVEANNEAVAGLAGIATGDLLLSEWTNSPYRPCHYVAIDRANQCVVLSIRCAARRSAGEGQGRGGRAGERLAHLDSASPALTAGPPLSCPSRVRLPSGARCRWGTC